MTAEAVCYCGLCTFADCPETTQLREENERLRTALRVYAEPFNWWYVTADNSAHAGWLFDGADNGPELASKALGEPK